VFGAVVIATKAVHRLQIRLNTEHLESTVEGIPIPFPQVTSGSVREGMRRWTDRHTDGHRQYTFRLGYASREM